MTTTQDRAVSRRPRAAARCASIAREVPRVLSIAVSGFTGFCAGAALIAYHVVGTAPAGRAIAAYVAVLVFVADRYATGHHLFTRWLLPVLAPLTRHLPHRWDPCYSAHRERYFQLDDEAGKLMRKLGREDDPAKRAALLDDLATAEQAMAGIHMEAFGPSPIEWEDGRDLSESMGLSASLVRIIAQCEHVLAGAPLPREFPAELTAAERLPLPQLWAFRDRNRRADLIDELYEACVDRVGGQAAESLASLAYAERETARRAS